MSRIHLLSLIGASTLIASFTLAETPVPPDWALPGGPDHKQVSPPLDFHRPSVIFDAPIGMFEGQSDVGGPLVPGSASYDPAAKKYTINSAGYNIWYNRDEFRFLWKKMSGDVSLAADITFPGPEGYNDRKVVLVVRQEIDDDSREVMAGLHCGGLIHLIQRSEKNAQLSTTYRFKVGDRPTDAPPIRLGLEKHGDVFALLVSLNGEPLHPVGPTADFHLDGPFYVGIGYCAHEPVTVSTGAASNVLLEPAAIWGAPRVEPESKTEKKGGK